MHPIIECDVAIIGGGLGGIAAGLAASQGGARAILCEESDWLGGQVTSQAVSALDEHQYIESVPGTESYADFRRRVREKYLQVYGQPAVLTSLANLNPGNGWVSRLCFEPRVGLEVIREMLAPYISSGNLFILLQCKPIGCYVKANKLQSVKMKNRLGEVFEIRASFFLDATELGDLLPLAGIPYAIGAEAKEETGEPHASIDGPHPERVQSFTYCFVVEYREGEKHIIPKPEGYDLLRDNQPYSLTLFTHDGKPVPYQFMVGSEQVHLPFWTYRRLFDSALWNTGNKGDVALINWDSNDFRGGGIVDLPNRIIRNNLLLAKLLSLGFLYWLQTEVKRDDAKGFGYPELRLLKGAVGTRDGLAKRPYVREARRIKGEYRIIEQDILADHAQVGRQAQFFDTVGVGWYSIDLHPCVGYRGTLFLPTIPFQIPMGALISKHCDNLIASGKNISTTHITNGAYRLHHIEWAIGSAAGSLAAYCTHENCSPRSVRDSQTMLARFQQMLESGGTTLRWPQSIIR